MIEYKLATKQDCKAIAKLHAQSWKESYRGMLTDEYLDTKVDAERLVVWTNRFKNSKPKQHIKVAKVENELVGFACTYFGFDAQWGAMLDNLHVAAKWKKRGIGKKLMQDAMKATFENNPESQFYLWVLEANVEAINIYEYLGGRNVEQKQIELAGIWVESFRYVWEKGAKI